MSHNWKSLFGCIFCQSSCFHGAWVVWLGLVELIQKVHFGLIFDFGSTALQDYFTHCEPNSLLGWTKVGDPQEKTPAHLQAELDLSPVSHVTRAGLKPRRNILDVLEPPPPPQSGIRCCKDKVLNDVKDKLTWNAFSTLINFLNYLWK